MSERSYKDATNTISSIFNEVGKVIVGQREAVEQIIAAILCNGHALVESYPGLGKTLTISTLAKVMDLKFNRIQCTPDLMPSDITGTYVVEERAGGKEFRFEPGPIFANIVLADEINRASPKTQSALLEAMQERQVTAGKETYTLDQPFFILATQNPIEMEGTYPLPEAQLDRFLLKILLGYPNPEEETEIVERYTGNITPTVEKIRRIRSITTRLNRTHTRSKSTRTNTRAKLRINPRHRENGIPHTPPQNHTHIRSRTKRHKHRRRHTRDTEREVRMVWKHQNKKRDNA